MKTPAEDHSDRDYFLTMGIFSVAILAFVLANREPPRATRSLDAWLRDLSATEPFRRTSAEVALRQMGVRVVPALLARLESSDTNDQMRAVLAFAVLGDMARPAIPQLSELLQREGSTLLAARALAAIGPTGVPMLTNALAGPVGFIRSSSARALGRMSTNGRLAVPALIGALEDSDDDLRYFAARALGNLAVEPVQAVPALLTRLEDRSVEVRKIAARSLGQFRGLAKVAVPALLKALNNDAVGVKLTAAWALREIDPAIENDGPR